MATTTPLSPSRLLNNATLPPTLPPKKRMVLEEDDDFLSMLDEAENGFPEEDLGDLGPPVASSSSRLFMPMEVESELSPREDEEEVVMTSRPGVKEGKRRVEQEIEEGFEIEDDVDMIRVNVAAGRDGMLGSRAGYQKKAPTGPDYTSEYSNLSSVNLSIRPGYIEAASVYATNFEGKRITLPRRRRLGGYETSAAEKRKNSEALAELSHSMLDTSYVKMLGSIGEMKRLAERAAEEEASRAYIAALEPAKAPTDSTLWTDRYRPKKFTELLGDERVHRSALLWLKEWDQCVFKGSAKVSAAAQLQRERRKKRARDAKFGGAAEGEEERAPDPFGRPFEKILLLCGPPGLGKTTLAYVLARQAGYQVLEVNASDDRSGKIVEDRIRNALESQAITKEGGLTGSKPTCVIIDEIDGAGGGGETSFVKTLIKLVMEGSSLRKHKGKGKQDRPLLRPIICICNDLYAPILRPLRPLARIVRFSPPTNLMLVNRLRTICIEENLGADLKNLTMLAEVAEGDLRSCLNTLQFIKRKSTKVDADTIKSLVVGLKDTGTSSTVVINRLFKKPNRKKNAGPTSDKYLNRIVRDVQTCGEYEKISQGCFENYLSARQSGDEWDRIIKAQDWLFLYDMLDGKLRSDRDYELLAYVPYTFVPWFPLFSSDTPKPMEFPKADYEAYLQRTAHQEIVDSFRLTIPHTLKTLFTGANIVVELLPLLNRIVAPDLKPVNSQLVKTSERIVMLKLISTMMSLKLSFVQDKNEEGQLSYKIEPPIDAFVHFEGKRASDIAVSRYAVRHLITREMDAERLRRLDSTEGAVTTASDILAAYKLKPDGQANAEMKEAIDFFGRAIAIRPLTAEELAAPPPIKKARKAVYKFNEGFSNAVRTTKRVADFLM